MTNLSYLVPFLIITIGITYYYSIYLFKLSKVAIHYFFNEKIVWNKHIDKPRSLVFFIASLFIFSISISKETSYDSIINLTVYLLSLFLMAFSYSPLFVKTVSFKRKENINSKSDGIKPIININNLDSKILFNEFIKFELCDKDTTLTEFNNAIQFNNKSKVCLKLDNTDIKLFHKLLKKHFILELNLKQFILSNSFLNKENIPYKYNSVKNYKSLYPKNEEIMKNIFNKIS